MGRDTKPQLFTDNLRKHLRGEPVSNPYDADRRVQNRVRHTFRDYPLLSNIGADDRRDIFGFKPLKEGMIPVGFDAENVSEHDITELERLRRVRGDEDPITLQMGSDEQPDGNYADVVAGTYHLLKFLYLGYRDAGRREQFLTILRAAMKAAEAEAAQQPTENVTVSVEARVETDTEYSLGG